MSIKCSNGYSKYCLYKEINNIKIYLYKSCDIIHGKGYFVHTLSNDFKVGFGFHKTNKLTAIRQSLNIL